MLLSFVFWGKTLSRYRDSTSFSPLFCRSFMRHLFWAPTLDLTCLFCHCEADVECSEPMFLSFFFRCAFLGVFMCPIFQVLLSYTSTSPQFHGLPHYPSTVLLLHTVLHNYISKVFSLQLEIGPDLTWAYFWPAVNKGPNSLWPRYFLTQPVEIFLIRREKIEKLR